jgi:NDP-sugar pyrophosphorylase family protein
MKAVVLAGGKGTRLAPYTTVLPKPLVPVGGVPILETVLRQLRHYGFREVVLAVGYLSPLIRAYFDSNAISTKLWLRYHQEQAPLGTAGALASIEDLDEPFLAMNGDLLTTLDYGAMMRFHRERGAALTVAVTERQLQVEVGVLGMDAEDRIIGYEEKPIHRFRASMGIYICSPRVRAVMDPGMALDIPGLVLRLIQAGELVIGYRTEAFWLDMGNREDYERASDAFERNRALFLPDEA